jgi:hypothetical protein
MVKLSSVRMPESPPFLSPCYRQKQKVELFKRIVHSWGESHLLPNARMAMFLGRAVYVLEPHLSIVPGQISHFGLCQKADECD